MTDKTSEVPPGLPTMEPGRMGEIAILLQMLRYHRMGTQAYVSHLKGDAEDLKISDEEMLEFFKQVFQRMPLRL